MAVSINEREGEKVLEHKCRKCGKNFIPTYDYTYKDEKGGFYCSWTCYRHRAEKKRAYRFKAVGQYTKGGDLVKVFDNATDAAETTGHTPKSVRDACRFGKALGGFLWRYEGSVGA